MEKLDMILLLPPGLTATFMVAKGNPSVLPFLCEFRRRPKHNITGEIVTKPSLEKLFMAHFPALKLHFFLVYFILSDIHSQCECIFMYVFVWSG